MTAHKSRSDQKQAELCQAQYKLGQAMQEASLFATKYQASQMLIWKLAQIYARQAHWSYSLSPPYWISTIFF